MERLTKRDKFGCYVPFEENTRTGTINYRTKTRGRIVDRLAELEDELENGTLLKLPCIKQTHNHKGEIVYRAYFLDHYWNAIRYYEANDEKEAEKRLEELKG